MRIPIKQYVLCKVGLVILSVSVHAWASSCYESSIISPSPFMGNNNEIFKLSDGSIWKVMYEYEYLYEYYPIIAICPSEGKLLIKGKSLNVQQVSSSSRRTPEMFGDDDLIESHIEGEFHGWEGDTIFKLDNGQVWQQANYAYKYTYKYHPSVTIYKSDGRYEMQVDGMDDKISVKRIK